jgi:hypothetical protein
LIAEGRIEEQSCIVIIDTGVSATIARPDITTELPESDLTKPYVQKMPSSRKLQ